MMNLRPRRNSCGAIEKIKNCIRELEKYNEARILNKFKYLKCFKKKSEACTQIKYILANLN